MGQSHMQFSSIFQVVKQRCKEWVLSSIRFHRLATRLSHSRMKQFSGQALIILAWDSWVPKGEIGMIIN